MSFPFTAPTGLTFNQSSPPNGTLSWSPSSLVTDPTMMLLHFDDANGSTTTTDSGPHNLAVTFHGMTQVTHTNPKFGPGCLEGPGGSSSDYVSVPIAANGPIDLSNTDFTVEFWCYVNSYEGGAMPLIFALNSAGTVGYALTLDGSGTLSVAGSAPIVGTHAVGIGQWTAIAYVRQGNNFGIWINGVSVSGVITFSGSIGTGTVLQLRAGAPLYGDGFDGQIDEVRISNQALYTPGTNYTPATQAFTYPVRPPGYDIYRNGVSIGTVTGTSFFDIVGVPGAYTYTVAAWDGVSSDISPPSAPLAVVSTVQVYGKFLPAPVFAPSVFPNSSLLEPRVWMPKENVTVIT